MLFFLAYNSNRYFVIIVPDILEKEEHLNFTRNVVSCLPDIERDTLAQIIETSHAIMSSNVGEENKDLFLKGLGE